MTLNDTTTNLIGKDKLEKKMERFQDVIADREPENTSNLVLSTIAVSICSKKEINIKFSKMRYQ